ncbi:hypothetical protein SK066_10795 [Paenibacillus hunanensis]|uniref:hypothetical protein n=1 Tax=Paenibacillus hunanensis TaxID=539262 RepID=UPI002A6AFE8D|nr:hypothetical protein [Paenibacillus hunanensis]WPP43384.1 hypothetical protein SK066_10795 [Paenibacillus hunanensis]
MMKTVIIIIALIIIAIMIFRKSNTPERQMVRRLQENIKLFNKVGPPGSLVPAGHPAEALANKLEASIPEHYAVQLWQRIQSEHPDMTYREFEWRWHEMKRYMLICALFREVPMFSSRVDDVWHEMLMFTREYEQLCNRFYGYMLHHSPHGGTVSQPQQRALFDWVYGELFPLERANTNLWGTFFRQPLPSSIMNELLAFSEYQPQHSLFNSSMFERSPEAREVILHLYRRFTVQSQAALRGERPEQQSSSNYAASSDTYNSSVFGLSAAGAACVYYSYLPPGDFSSCVDPFLPADVREERPVGGTSSSCGTGSSSSDNYTSNDSHHGGGHSGGSHGGHSCSSSSCSSSSCSSSCSSCGGGGGD